VPASAGLDRERPVEQAKPLAALLPADTREVAIHAALRTMRSVAVLGAVVLVWSWLLPWLDGVVPRAWLPDGAPVPILVAGGVVGGGAALGATRLLTLTAVLILGPGAGFLAALGGLMAAAMAGWLAGRIGWSRGVRRVAGPHV